MKTQQIVKAALGLAIAVNAHDQLLHSRSKTHNKFSWANTKYLLAFGDSYTYVQGTNGLQNFSFIGDYLDLAFTPSQLLDNDIVQNQTATAEGGPNWVEYLTGCGLSPGLTSPLSCTTQLWDFAFGGADISTQYTPQHHNFTTPLVNQTQQFITYGQPALSPIINATETLVTFWIGINDVSDSKNYAVDFTTFYNELMTTLFTAVSSIYALGYRNFLFMNLPPLDRTPGRTLPPNAMTAKVDLYDAALHNHSHAFRHEHTDAKVMLFHVNHFLNGVMDHAAEYGIKNTTGYCPSYDQPYINTDPGMYGCLPLPEYFWFDDGHMTSHVHEILAGQVEKFLVAESD